MVELIEERQCELCKQRFTPKREWQKFCCSAHQNQYWKEVHLGKYHIYKRLKKIEEKLGIKNG